MPVRPKFDFDIPHFSHLGIVTGLCALLLMTSCAAPAHRSEAKGPGVVSGFFEPAPDKAFEYNLFVPYAAKDQKLPMLLSFPGAGISVSGEMANWQDAAGKAGIMVATASFFFREGSKNPRVHDYVIFLDEMARKYSIDTSRVFVAGASAGCLTARDLLYESPERFRGAIFMASPNIEKLIRDPGAKQYPPMFFVHGEKDEQFPYKEKQRLVELLKQKGYSVSLLSDPNAGHTHDPKWNTAIFDWMDQQTGGGAQGEGETIP
ncbi:MAG: prolyl oligopeptidase family serine peptidase [Candidatus Omnitrophota bacterium]|jgi:predicted esterase